MTRTGYRTVQTEAVYDAAQGFRLVTALRELWAYREVVVSFASRRLRTRYAQAVFGAGWAIVQPLAFLALFVVFLRSGAEPPGTSSASGAGSYAAGSYAALVGWQFASASIASAGASLVSESSMLRKVYFPREAPVLGAVGAYLPDLAINTVLLVALAPLFGGRLGWAALATPIPYLVLAVAALAVGLPLAALAVYYRDFLYALPIGVQILLFASPVAYPLDTREPVWRYTFAILNPLAGPLDALRRIYGSGSAPEWGLVAASALSSLVLLAGGYRLLKALDRRMADVI